MRNINKVNNLSSCYVSSLGVMLLSLSLLLFTGCEIMSDSSDSEFDLSQVTGFDVSISGEGILESTFFALKVGTQWKYELVHSDVDTGLSAFYFPTNFTMSVIGTETLDTVTYYLVENYFIPGPSLPNPTLIRIDNNYVYAIIEGTEYLFYSFSEDDTLWSLPLYVNPAQLYRRDARQVLLTDDAAGISWDLHGFPGPNPVPGSTQSGWGEVFNRNLGRVRIISGSQAYGLTVWDLIKVTIKG